MKQYLELLQAIQKNGTDKPAARANMPGTRSLFGYQFRHDLADGFPLLTTKKMFWKGVVVELLWFLRGDTNIKYLVDNGVNIWNEDAYSYYSKQNRQYPLLHFEAFVDCVKRGTDHLGLKPALVEGYTLGDCGNQYGKLWRDWRNLEVAGTSFHPRKGGTVHYKTTYVDQIAELIKGLKNSPESRRHILTAWNPATLDQMALNACHVLVQFNCRSMTQLERCNWMAETRITMSKEELDEEGVPKYKLDCQLYQRSADSVLGVPFNIASYALLIHMIAKMVNMVPGDFIHTFGDAHIYDNHTEAVSEQLSRTPTKLPQIYLNDRLDWVKLGDTLAFDKLVFSDFLIAGYNPQPSIKAELKTGL